MKWFCKIFSLYVLILACTPCSDMEHTHVMANGTTISKTASEPCQNDNCADFCSPLCYCACCGSSVHIISIFHLETAKIIVDCPIKTGFRYKSVLTSSYLNTQFRPPQVG